MPVVVISSKGQIVLPKEVREALQLREGDRLRLTVGGDHMLLNRLPGKEQSDWQQWRGSLSGTQALQEHLAEKRD